MKVHDRVCVGCSLVLEETRSRSPLCAACAKIRADAGKADENRLLLEEYYDDVVGPSAPNKNGKREWTFTHHECGTRQTWVMGNVKTQLKKNPEFAPCSHCGKQRR